MNAKVKGITYALIGGTCWGLSGIVGKLLFDTRGLNAQWLVTARLIIGGLIMLLIAFLQKKEKIFDVWKNKKTACSMLLFAAFGMLACQLTYFLCVQYSNPATATVLQYTSPVMIMILCLFLDRKAAENNRHPCSDCCGCRCFSYVNAWGHPHSCDFTKGIDPWNDSGSYDCILYGMAGKSFKRVWIPVRYWLGNVSWRNHAGTIFKILGTIRKVGWVYGNISWNRYYFWNRMCIYLLFKRSHVFRTGEEQSVFLYGAACLNNSYNHSTAPDICHGRSCRNCSHYYQRDFVSSK